MGDSAAYWDEKKIDEYMNEHQISHASGANLATKRHLVTQEITSIAAIHAFNERINAIAKDGPTDHGSNFDTIDELSKEISGFKLPANSSKKIKELHDMISMVGKHLAKEVRSVSTENARSGTPPAGGVSREPAKGGPGKESGGGEGPTAKSQGVAAD
jgi:hypothetical protein